MMSLRVCYRKVYKKSFVRNGFRFSAFTPVLFPIDHTVMCKAAQSICTSLSAQASANDKKPLVTESKPVRFKDGGRGSPHSFTVFSAGSAKERSNIMQNKVKTSPESQYESLKKREVNVPTVPLGAKEWSKLKEEFKRPGKFEEFMMEQMISTKSDINVAKSLLTFAAKEQCGISYKLLLKYLALCVQQHQIAEVYDVYEIMKNSFKSFDTGAYSLFIKGFSQTDRWKEAITMLEKLKKSITPSPRNYGECIQGAIQHRDKNLAWALYKEMLQAGLTPCEETIQSLFNAELDLQDDAFRNNLIDILNDFRDHQIYPGEPLMQSIKSWFESTPNESWKGHISSVSVNGYCQNCKQQLESIHLMPEEYNSLKDIFIHSVIQGHDTFRKTTPQELQDFQQFVRSRPPYDVVVDGLNVAFISNKGAHSKTLLDVVTSLASGGKRVLVLGRKHMLQESRTWLRQHIKLMQQRVDCFFLDNISEDDPFLLYASLNSGSHCCFLTRDLMRDHKSCLPDAPTRRLFFKWQRGHQLVIPFYTPGSKLRLQPIMCYDTILQRTNFSWHIPFDKMGVNRASFEVPKTWLCLQKKH
ncbi:hypothetical protein GDO86_016262 [Hymenochirus boettgeri]|uniref:Mitochondrial ribonuclease P catalytic subunit n=1 Tax=Hymenochirus boettgeri TaxID=247094 RepID=A0A8T2K1C3_9PIPI|nr:hypothetical protein GDO86_016262 [Hymenochirus boettgeri]